MTTSNPPAPKHAVPRRMTLLSAAVFGLFAVGIGAFGAHGLEDMLVKMGRTEVRAAELLTICETAVRYHFFHTLVLLAIVAMPPSLGRLKIVSWLFALGILLFSGSLYLLVLTDVRWLGAITPLGGTLWLVAWGMLGYTAIVPPSVSQTNQANT
ncbi:MAG: DUF423 domain-containing protein [Planctomycetota bacterium]